MATYTYKHVSFNLDHAAGQKVEDFIKQEGHHGLTKAELEQAHKDIRKQYNAAKRNETDPVSIVRDEHGKVVPLAAGEAETPVGQPEGPKPK